MNIEVAILLFSRSKNIRLLFDSIVSNGVTKVSVFLDYSDNQGIVREQRIIKDILSEYLGIIDISLIERGSSLGLAGSVRGAMNEMFANGGDAVILLEDDCILLPQGIDFFYQGLKELRYNKKIRSLCGYNLLGGQGVIDPDSDLLLLNRFSTWGWATWKDRWSQHEPDLRVLVNSIKSVGINIEDFSKDIANKCHSDRYLDGVVDIWSLNWILLHYLTSSFAVYPPESVIYNVGLDGSGVNCSKNDVFNIVYTLENRRTSYNWRSLKYITENEALIEEFMERNSCAIYPDI